MLSTKHLKVLLPVFLLLIGLIIARELIVNKPKLPQQTPANEPPLVSVMTVLPETLRLDVHTQGIVKPRTDIDLVAEVAGKITYVHPNFLTGGFFNENELLLTIESGDYDYAIAEAEARIAEAKRLLISEQAQAQQARNEWKTLGEGSPTPLVMREPQLAEAQAKLKAGEADLLKAKLKRSRCKILAPFNGRVLEKNFGFAQYIQSGEKLARIYATNVAEVRLPLTSEQLSFIDLPIGRNGIAINKQPKVTLTSEFSGVLSNWNAHIVRTEGMIDTTSGQLHVVAEVINPYQQLNQQLPLIAGLFVSAIVQGKEQQNVFILPLNAINTAHEVMVVDKEQRLHIKKVEVLRFETERVLIKNGLTAGDQIITHAIQVPIDGMKVKIDTSSLKKANNG